MALFFHFFKSWYHSFPNNPLSLSLSPPFFSFLSSLSSSFRRPLYSHFFWGQNLCSHFSLQLSTYNPQQRTYSITKQVKYFDRDDVASEEDYSILQPYGKPTAKQDNYTKSDKASDDSMDDNSHMQQERNFKVKEPKFVDSDVVSDDTMRYHSDSQMRRELSNKQIEDSERDGVSKDSMRGGSLKQRRKTVKASQPNMMWMQICIRKKKLSKFITFFNIKYNIYSNILHNYYL